MTRIEAIIRPDKLDEVKTALDAVGVNGMTITHVMGAGKQKGQTEYYRGQEYAVRLLDKVKLETIVPDTIVDSAVEAIMSFASTGEIGDGKIFLSKVDDSIRIRTGERGDSALR